MDGSLDALGQARWYGMDRMDHHHGPVHGLEEGPQVQGSGPYFSAAAYHNYSAMNQGKIGDILTDHWIVWTIYRDYPSSGRISYSLHFSMHT